MPESTTSVDRPDLEPAIRPIADAEQSSQPAPTTETDATADTASGATSDDAEPEHPAEAVPDDSPETFEAAIEASHLKQLLAIVEAVVEECRFHLGQDALYIRAIGPANVAMTDIAVSPAAFETYESSGGTIGLDLDRLDEVLTVADKGELIQFTLNPTTRKLTITIDAMEFTLALINPQTIRQEPNLPELALPATVTIAADDLARAIKAGDMVSDHLCVGVNPTLGCVQIKATGDTDTVNLEIDRADCEMFDNSATEPIESMFSLEYLKDLSRPFSTGTPLTIELGNEFPLDLTFSAVEDTIDGRFLLAPRRPSD